MYIKQELQEQICKTCGKPFISVKSNEQKYCSEECRITRKIKKKETKKDYVY